jgi:hypothetical protein
LGFPAILGPGKQLVTLPRTACALPQTARVEFALPSWITRDSCFIVLDVYPYTSYGAEVYNNKSNIPVDRADMTWEPLGTCAQA